MTKLNIKVIKKEAVEIYKTSVAVENKPKRKISCQIASNVSGWVNEFQHRRREEQKKAFNHLFALRS